MQLVNTSGTEIRGCAVFYIGRFEVSVSTVFERGGTAVFKRGTRDCVKEFYGHSPETVVEAIQWAKHAENRARSKHLSEMAAMPQTEVARG